MVAFALLSVTVTGGFAQSDPGIRGGPIGAGQPFTTGLSGGEPAFFSSVGAPTFAEVESVARGPQDTSIQAAMTGR